MRQDIRRITTSLAALLAFPLALACSGADEPPEEGINPTTEEVASAPDAGEGSATLTLGDETYELAVEFCSLQGTADPEDRPTVLASGRSAEGEPLTLEVSRYDTPALAIQSITFREGGYSPTEPYWDAAYRDNLQGSWVSEYGEGGTLEQPPLKIDGDRLTADVAFYQITDQGDEPLSQRQGQLVVSCQG